MRPPGLLSRGSFGCRPPLPLPGKRATTPPHTCRTFCPGRAPPFVSYMERAWARGAPAGVQTLFAGREGKNLPRESTPCTCSPGGSHARRGRACRYSFGLARPRGSKPRSPGSVPSSQAGRSVLGSHRSSPVGARQARCTVSARLADRSPWTCTAACAIKATGLCPQLSVLTLLQVPTHARACRAAQHASGGDSVVRRAK